MHAIAESDWKVLRDLKTRALERCCQHILDAVRLASDAPAATAHERYLRVFRLIEEQDKELSEMFDDLRRSNATWRIGMMRNAGLITDEEYARFSEELRDVHSLLRNLAEDAERSRER
jgi:hypothetical protein